MKNKKLSETSTRTPRDESLKNDSSEIIVYEFPVPATVVSRSGWLIVETDEHFNVLRVSGPFDRLPWMGGDF